MSHEEALSGCQDSTISATGRLQCNCHWKETRKVANGAQIFNVTMNYFRCCLLFARNMVFNRLINVKFRQLLINFVPACKV